MSPARTGPTAGVRPRVLLALTLLLSLVALYGCGTVIDREKLQDTVQASLESSVHAKIQDVECPADVSVDPGATFTCTVIFSHDKRDVAILKIRNKDADITMVGLKPSK